MELINFKTETVIRDKEGYYIMIKSSSQEDDIRIINIYAPDIGAPQHVRQIQATIKGEINSNSRIVGNINTLLLSMDRSSRYNINMETLALENTLQQRNFRDMYIMFHPKAIE